MKKIIAKSDGTSLKKHSKDSHEIMKILLDSNRKLLQNRLKFLNVENIDEFLNHMEKSSVFHDFGKSSFKWQKIANIYSDNSNLPPHAFYSGYFLKPNDNSIVDMVTLLSVVSHHSLLTENSFNFGVDSNMGFYEDYLVDIVNGTNFSINKFTRISEYKKWLISLKENCQRGVFRDLYDKDKFFNLFFKSYYTLFLSYLTMSDGLSSEFEENNQEISINNVLKKYPSSHLVYEKIKYISKNINLNPIQNSIYEIKNVDEIDLLMKPVLMEAPCGEGKTLASLLFSKELFKNNLINKVIFLLPTQVTSNNMFFEFEKEYKIPNNWIGIYHSEVLNFLIKNNDDDLNINLEKYYNLIYSKPFNISTIDHLLLSLVNGFKHAPKAFGNMLNSLIIIDELHYYDSYTLSMIEVLCEILRFLKIPHLIMSATIPKHIKDKFSSEDYCKIQSSGNDLKGIEKHPFNFIYHSSTIFKEDNLSNEFKFILEENLDKNLGIIVNTVPLSQKLFKEIKKLYPNKQILLYNARFMKKDRPLKEKLIKSFSNVLYDKATNQDYKLLEEFGFNPYEKFIFIGTQVAEISLNMSFDTIISELAPFDALIQRGGRLHRKETYDNSSVCNCIQCSKLDNNHKFYLHIFETGKFCHPYYNKNNGENSYQYNIINNTRKIVKENPKYTFKNSVELMNKVYDVSCFEEDNNIKLRFEKIIKEDLIFGKPPSYNEEDGGQLRIQTRIIDIQNISVLPLFFNYGNDEFVNIETFIREIYKKYNFKGKFTQEGINKISECMINVSYSFFCFNNGQSISIGGCYFNIIDLFYNFEEGLYEENSFM